MTMEQFGEKIGVSKATISNIENGNRNATEHMVKSICREFHADYLWLRTGEGEMFFEDDEVSDTLDRIEEALEGESEFAKRVFKMFSKYSYEDWERLAKVVEKSKVYLQEIEMSESDTKKED